MAQQDIVFPEGLNTAWLKVQDNFDELYGSVPFINVKNEGVTGDGVTNDTATVNALIETYKTGGHLHFPEGVYILDAYTMTGDAPNTTNLTISGVGAASITDLRTSDFSTGTILSFTGSSGDFWNFDGVQGLYADYTNQIQNIIIKNLSIIGSTTGSLLNWKRVNKSQIENVTIRNNGAGTGFKIYDGYASTFSNIDISSSSIVSGSTGLHYDTYEGGGGMASFSDMNISYQDEGLFLGSDVASASKYEGLESIAFNSVQTNNNNKNVRLANAGATTTPSLQPVIFNQCYFELNLTGPCFVLQNGCNVALIGSSVNSNGTQNTFELGGATAAQYSGITLSIENSKISSPSSGGAIFYSYDDTDAVYNIKNTSFKNNGNLSFDFESTNGFNGKILLENIKYDNWTDRAFLSDEAKLYVTHESPKKVWSKISNTTLDRSSKLTIPAKIKASTSSADAILLLPTSVNIDDGTAVTVFKENSANNATLDAGTGNTLTIDGVKAQTHSFTSWGASVSFRVINNGATLNWLAE